MKKKLDLTFGGKLVVEDYAVYLDDAKLEDVIKEALGKGNGLVRVSISISPIENTGLVVTTDDDNE